MWLCGGTTAWGAEAIHILAKLDFQKTMTCNQTQLCQVRFASLSFYVYIYMYTLNVPFLRNHICCTKQKPTYSDVVEHATSPKYMVVLKGFRMVIQPAVEWDVDI